MKRRDHCTLFPDGDWHDCCQNHDIAYRRLRNIKPPAQRNRSRKAADRDLLVCVALGGRPHLAILMFYGTRIFGHPAFAPLVRWAERLMRPTL